VVLISRPCDPPCRRQIDCDARPIDRGATTGEGIPMADTISAAAAWTAADAQFSFVAAPAPGAAPDPGAVSGPAHVAGAGFAADPGPGLLVDFLTLPSGGASWTAGTPGVADLLSTTVGGYPGQATPEDGIVGVPQLSTDATGSFDDCLGGLLMGN
jgi:hypothetical protein